jgi:hypothetical protein
MCGEKISTCRIFVSKSQTKRSDDLGLEGRMIINRF